MQNKITCPYCDDAMEYPSAKYETKRLMTHECATCKKMFNVEIEINYHVFKGCEINKENHVIHRTRYTDIFECVKCHINFTKS